MRCFIMIMDGIFMCGFHVLPTNMLILCNVCDYVTRGCYDNDDVLNKHDILYMYKDRVK